MQWFKHDTDANQDAKLQNVLLDYGIEGYGLYWYCIELIAGSISEENLTFQLEHDARIIAKNTGNTPQKVEEMMRYFVSLGLFEDDNGTISCMKLRSRLNKSMTSNPAIRKLITSDKVESKDYSGFVYFIHAKNGDVSKIKIGRSKNPHARLNDLKKRKDCLGFELRLIHTIKSDDCISLETEHHRRFKNENLVDEWFNPSDQLISYLRDDLLADYDLTTIMQNRIEEKRREENKIEENKRVISTDVPTPAPKNDYTKEREEAFEYLWQTWSDCKKRIGTKNKAQKQKAKTVFMNNTFPAGRVRSQIEKNGMEAFENEVDAMINLAWREHEEVYEDMQNGGHGFFPITNAHPQNFLKGVAWRE